MFGITSKEAEVSVAKMPEKIKLDRRVARVKRIRQVLESNPKHPKAVALNKELDKHLEELLLYKDQIEELLS